MMKFRSLALVAVFVAALFISHAHAQGAGQLGAGQVWGNPTASAGRGIPSNISAILDQALGSTRGAILERGLSGWGIVAPNATAGLAYASNGTGADPSYQIVPIVGGGSGANTASGARTNLGLAIGTNVEAWDNDLDCLAALATTGVIHRTGTGTCSAGAVALTDIIAGTSDTVLGYFGSTAVSAASIPNCTGALVYSTSTHLFTCNTTAGTGTVTGPVSSTNTAVATYNGTGGTVIQNSPVTIDSSGNMAGINSITGNVLATKVQQQAGTNTSSIVTPLHQQDHDSALKAWIIGTVATGTITIQQAYNMSLSSKSGVGNYLFNFTTAFNTTLWDCSASANGTVGQFFLGNVGTGTRSTTQINATFGLATTFTLTDPANFKVECVGRQ